MAIIGSILKGLINFHDKVTTDPNPKEAQQRVLKTLLETAKDTAFGKHYEFDKILES